MPGAMDSLVSGMMYPLRHGLPSLSELVTMPREKQTGFALVAGGRKNFPLLIMKPVSPWYYVYYPLRVSKLHTNVRHTALPWVPFPPSGVFIGAVLLAGFLRRLAGWIRRWWILRKIPQPKGGNFLLGNALQMLRDIPWDLTAKWAKENNGLAYFRVIDKLCITTDHPEVIKRIFQSRFENYGKDLEWSYNEFIRILGSGLVTAGGDHWKDQRRRMSPVLKTNCLQWVVEIADQATRRLMSKLDAVADSPGGTIDIEEEFRLLTLQVIGMAALTLPPEECDRVFPELYLPVMEENNRRVLRPWRSSNPLLPAFWQHRSRMAQLDQYLTGHIRQRWAEMQRSGPPVSFDRADFLTQILAFLYTHEDDHKRRLTKEEETQVCYELKTFLLAGHETSAAMLTWSTYELSLNPQLREKVAAETAQFIPYALKGEKLPDKNDVDKMAFTHGVLKEALRKYSVVPVVTRIVHDDDVLLDHVVPKGTYVMCMVQGIHQHHWKKPQAFLPERFLPGGEYDQFEENIRPFMFIPFIAGPRNCLGQWLALLEARVVLGLLASKYTFETVNPKAGERHRFVVPVGPRNGMEVKVRTK